MSPAMFVFGSHEVPCSEESHAAFRLCCGHLDILNNLWTREPLFPLHRAPRIMYLGPGSRVDVPGPVDRLDMGYTRKRSVRDHIEVFSLSS